VIAGKSLNLGSASPSLDIRCHCSFHLPAPSCREADDLKWPAGDIWWATRCPEFAMLLFMSPANGSTVFDVLIPVLGPLKEGVVTLLGCKRGVGHESTKWHGEETFTVVN